MRRPIIYTLSTDISHLLNLKPPSHSSGPVDSNRSNLCRKDERSESSLLRHPTKNVASNRRTKRPTRSSTSRSSYHACDMHGKDHDQEVGSSPVSAEQGNATYSTAAARRVAHEHSTAAHVLHPDLHRGTVAELLTSLPEEGIEPSLPCGNGILNPARLPIPPLRLAGTPCSTPTYRVALSARGTGCFGPVRMILPSRPSSTTGSESAAKDAKNRQRADVHSPRQSIGAKPAVRLLVARRSLTACRGESNASDEIVSWSMSMVRWKRDVRPSTETS